MITAFRRYLDSWVVRGFFIIMIGAFVFWGVGVRLLLAGLPLNEVTTSMTINSTASTLLLLYQLVGEEQGIKGDQLRGTIQNDILKE